MTSECIERSLKACPRTSESHSRLSHFDKTGESINFGRSDSSDFEVGDTNQRIRQYSRCSRNHSMSRISYRTRDSIHDRSYTSPSLNRLSHLNSSSHCQSCDSFLVPPSQSNGSICSRSNRRCDEIRFSTPNCSTDIGMLSRESLVPPSVLEARVRRTGSSSSGRSERVCSDDDESSHENNTSDRSDL